MWTRRVVQRMIDAELGTDVEETTEKAADAAVAMSSVTEAANAVNGDGGTDGGTGLAAEVAGDVARHREQPTAGLMGRGF